ncbi:MAG: hypothetical protein IPK12_21935 [Gemmatimonadetes bacterium]|nr:hypothetical protein [Gemmatimonadota bacterium]
MASASWYWRLFNIAARVLGLAFLGGGLALAGLSSSTRVPVGASAVPASLPDSEIAVITGLVVAALGALLLAVRPFRPDLGETSALVGPVGAKAARGARRPYRWWTGEPVRARVPPSN